MIRQNKLKIIQFSNSCNFYEDFTYIREKTMKKHDVILTRDQEDKLFELWFIYGNRGSKHTDLNHKYIQGFIKHGEDREKAYKNADLSKMKKIGRDLNTVRLTNECIEAVKKILKQK